MDVFIISLASIFILVQLLFLYKQAIEIDELKSARLTPEETDTVREDFLKFISDSREWAFQYIETMQAELEEFIKIVHPIILSWEQKEMFTQDQLILRNAYYDIVKLLPKD